MAKPLTLLTHQKAKCESTPAQHTSFLMLRDAFTQGPMLCCPNPAKQCIVYTDASDNACRTQLSQKHNGMELPIAFLSHTFTDTQQKGSTIKQEAYGVYYAVTKWNYYLQGTEIIIHNDHKPLTGFLNGKKAKAK